MYCSHCIDEVIDGVIKDGYVLCFRCSRYAPDAEEDTPSLQDKDPEGHGYITNTNPWTGEKGY